MVSEGRGLLGQGSAAGGMAEASALVASANGMTNENDGTKENKIKRRHVEVDIRTLLGSGTPAILRGKSRLGIRREEAQGPEDRRHALRTRR